MKVGILTFHFVDNYGAVLQAYGLQKALEVMGHEAEFIDYQPRYMQDGGPWRFPTSKVNLKINAQIAFIRFGNLRSRFGADSLSRLFADFRKNHLRVSAQRMSTPEAIKKSMSHYDAVICGSDQIWNPPLRAGVDPVYFGDASPDGTIRVAYAASFGRSEIESIYHSKVAELARKMDYVGVREGTGVELLEKISGVRASLTPDPTMLIDDYSEITKEAAPERYVFTYVLRGGGWVDQLQSSIASKFGIPSYSPFNPHQRWKVHAKQITVGPGEWLGRIRAAQFVVTNSFHGTVFSILFRKPFIAVGLDGSKRSLSTRVTSLLERVGLTDRFLTESEQAKAGRVIDTPIDWEKVESRIRIMRSEGRAFLAAALSGGSRGSGLGAGETNL